MTEARRLLKELADEMALWRGNKPSGYVDKYERARAYLAQPEPASREGELVAALEQALSEHQNCDPHRGCPPNAPCGMEASDGKWHGTWAALACPTCKGTRVAPPDLGGAGVTNSSCPDCVLE